MDLSVEVRLGQGGHKDLFLKIPLLGVSVCADTYYFVLALEERQIRVDEVAIRQAVVSLLQYWIDRASNLKDLETIHLPFDFSDQYTGCLQVTAEGSSFHLSYGFSLIEGWRVNPLSPGHYSHQVGDFRQQENCEHRIPRSDFIGTLNRSIADLESETAQPL
ncbi:hypothetical protein [Pseudophaeobacter flagellatus]|uniref:hypothetical protein n=1 Tax=Pseudophaeobacter flagellatus TaxID=2899119 RepID=UPI001E633189|nr:hypothetical protein [Pseudophaeobacter flagellatus]MCD9147803.1 hypothetical protein [Pseudophaeobacter flagellatus]